MKRLLPLVLAAAAAATAGASPALHQRGLQCTQAARAMHHSVAAPRNMTAAQMQARTTRNLDTHLNAPQREEEEMPYTLRVTVTDLPDGVKFDYFVMAMRETSGGLEKYFVNIFDMDDDGRMYLNIPAGTYDLAATVTIGDLEGQGIITKTGVTVTDTPQDMVWSAPTPLTSVQVNTVGPTGLTLEGCDFEGIGGNCGIGEAFTAVTYKDYGTVGAMSVTMFAEAVRFLLIDNPDGPFGFNHARFYGGWNDIGMVSMAFPVDFSLPSCGPTDGSGYMGFETEIQPTPYNIATSGMREGYYGWTGYDVYASGINYGGSGLAIFDIPANTGKVSMWSSLPQQDLAMAIYPMGPTLNGDRAVISRPVYIKGNELVQAGKLKAFWDYFGNSLENQNLFDGNPLFINDETEGKPGNCAPTVLFAGGWDPSSFQFTFIGRSGETFAIDDPDLDFDVPESWIEKFGTTSEYEVGEEHGLPKVTVTTWNVMVDGMIPGSTVAEMVYDPENGPAPTVSQLWFADSDGNLTDRFNHAADGTVSLYAGRFTQHEFYDGNRWFLYFDCDPVAGVKVEAAPYGTGDYVEISMEANASKDWTPCYGQFFSGNLAAVQALSPNGWFKIRTTVTTADGAVQTQVVEPAFHVLYNTGVEETAQDVRADIRIEGRDIIVPTGAEVFGLDGRRVSPRSLAPGIYTVVTPAGAVKVAI